MFLNKDASGADYNRALRRRRQLPLLPRPDAELRRRQERHAGRARARRRATTGTRRAASAIAATCWETRGDVPDDRRRASTTRWASCRASASTTASATSARTSGPKRFSELAARDLPALPDRELHQAQRRRARIALHGLALAGHVPEQHVRRGRRQPERRGDRRPLHDQQPPRHPRRPGPLRVQRELHPRQHQRRGAVLDQPALRHRRVLRRLPPRLHGRRHVRARTSTSTCR